MREITDIGKTLQMRSFYTAFRKVFSADLAFPGEQHLLWELLTVEEGDVCLTADEQVFHLHAGQTALIAPMEFHRVWSESNTPPVLTIFSFYADNFPIPSSRIFSLENPEELRQILTLFHIGFLFNDIYICGIKDSLAAQKAAKALELYLLTLLLQHPLKPQPATRSGQNFSQLVTFLHNNISRSLRTKDIAEQCAMSVSTVNQTFNKYAGVGILHYFNQLKVNSAITMLENGKSVQEVAEVLGFVNQSYFSTVFRRFTGRTPSEYKKSPPGR